MDGNLTAFFTNMIGTLAVILVIAAFIGGSEVLTKFFGSKMNWKYSLFAGLLGGVFGIYGTMSGLELNGFVDQGAVAGFASDAFVWAVATGLVEGSQGSGGYYLNPTANLNRASAAVLLQRCVEDIM